MKINHCTFEENRNYEVVFWKAEPYILGFKFLGIFIKEIATKFNIAKRQVSILLKSLKKIPVVKSKTVHRKTVLRYNNGVNYGYVIPLKYTLILF